MNKPGKALTGIRGFDEVTRGGLPQGRATLFCGGPGCGKTVMALEQLAHGARDFGEPGLFVSFEQPIEQLLADTASLGFELDALRDEAKLALVHIDASSDSLVVGDFTLDALMLRIDHAIEQVGARRIAIDSLDALFAHLSDRDVLRRELRRLFDWLAAKGLTVVVTAEAGRDNLTRDGVEAFVSDCVIVLDHRIRGQISKRRLRVLKYRGSPHGTDEYPFVIGPNGVQVLPITSAHLDYEVSDAVMSSGIADLDALLDKRGFFRGSTVLISGHSGTGKSSLAAAMAEAACARGERCIYLAFEESAQQIARNAASIGIDLRTPLDSGLLTIEAFRPGHVGLEEHLVRVLQSLDARQPDLLVLDPITNFISIGDSAEVKSMLTRLLDQLKRGGITGLLTALNPPSIPSDQSSSEISSLMDAWIALSRRVVDAVSRNQLAVIKARGMAHSHRMHELLLSDDGIGVRLFDGDA